VLEFATRAGIVAVTGGAAGTGAEDDDGQVIGKLGNTGNSSGFPTDRTSRRRTACRSLSIRTGSRALSIRYSLARPPTRTVYRRR
jgi:hypothetical protein